MTVGTLWPWCSVPWPPKPIGLLPRRTDHLNVDRGGTMAGCFCLWSCGGGCRALLGGHGRGLFSVGGVGRGVLRVCAERAAVERSGPPGAGVSVLLRGRCDVNGLIPSRLI